MMEASTSAICVSALFYTIIMTMINLSACEDLNYSIKEEQRSNQLIGNIGQDSNLKNMVNDMASLRFSLLTQGNVHSSLFKVTSTSGDLFISRRIDKESLCPFKSQCVLHIEVVASNQATGGVFFESVKIHINIEDINDNEPAFAKLKEEIEISESVSIGASYSLPVAIDKDTGENNTLKKYELSPKDGQFDVNFEVSSDGSSTVNLIVKKSLDRETTASYSVTLIASDGGQPSRSGSMVVDITVTDANDNSPVFANKVYNTSVRENTPVQTVIETVSASDKDIDKNGEIFYRFSARQSADIQKYFSMNAVSGEISLISSLGYQTEENIVIKVEASDKGVPPKTAHAVVEVTVIDTINNPPSIQINVLSGLTNAVISETAAIGSPVAHMGVTDPDNGKNGIVTCYSQNAAFDLRALDVNEYKVVVAKTLDYEQTKSYLVTVLCEDNGSPKLNSSVSFTVDIIDANDNKPVFIQTSYSVSVPENNSINDTILQVVATDADTDHKNGRVTYSLQGAAFPYFNINPNNGIIKAVQVLDREAKPSHEFQVLAFDNGQPRNTATAKVTINLLDINDKRPKFVEDSYTFYVYENRNSNTVVGNVSAFDPDLGPGGLFVFTLTSSETTTKLPFTISQEGILSTSQMLDSEAQSQYTFTLLATDRGVAPLTGSTQVTVIVLDENDNTPFFIFPSDVNRSITVYLPLSVNKTVVKINAEDNDSGMNGQVQFTLNSLNGSSLFNINPNTGDIIVTRDVKISELGTYFFLVEATDEGKIPNKVSEQFSIIVERKQEPEGLQDGEDNTNVIIVVALICSTLLVTVAVVIALCFIKRSDNIRRSKYQENQKVNSHNGSVTNNEIQVRHDGKDGQWNEMNGRDNPAFGSKSASRQGKDYKQVSNHDLKGNGKDELKVGDSINSSVVTEIPGGVAVGDRDHQRLIKMASIRLQKDLQLHSNHAPIHQKPLTYETKVREWQDHSRRAEDFHSTSSGEVTTGDSGHGSDEDSHYYHDRNSTPTKIRLGIGAIVRNHLSPTSSAPKNKSTNNAATPRQVKFVIPQEDVVSPIYSHYSHSHPSIRSDMTEDNDDTTTSGSYSIAMEDLRPELPDFNVIKDIYV